MNLWNDVRFGVRMLAKNKGLTAVITMALALGIGANTTVFTLVYSVLFKPLPFVEGHRIIYVSCQNLPKGQTRMGVSHPDFVDWRAQSKAFKALAAWEGMRVNLSDRITSAEQYEGNRMTPNSFSLIGQNPLHGRDFTPDDAKPGAPAVTIIGYGIFKNRYGGDPSVVGKTVRLNENPVTIIGVMPPDMKFPLRADIWTPLILNPDPNRRDARSLSVFGRLADGVSLPEAQAEISTIARRLEHAYSIANQGITPLVKTFNDEFNGGNIRIVFFTLLGAVGFVLLIACANVANLLLARAMSRTREIAVRSALGASRWTVVRQLLIESVLLGLLGGLAGLALAYGGVRAFDLAVANVGKPYWIKFTMDWAVFGYLAAICLTTGLLFGLAPALQASKLDLSETLKEGGRGTAGMRGRWLSSALVVTELSLALVLLIGAGLMIRSFLNIYGMQTTPNASRLLTMRLSLLNQKYPTPESRQAFYDKLMPRLRAIPGAESVAVTSNLPTGGAARWKLELEGDAPVEIEKRPNIWALIVDPGYFRTTGQQLLRGSDFGEADGATGKPVVIVSQSFVKKYWPNDNPLGKRLRLHRKPELPWLTVVGVSPDMRVDQRRAEIDPLVYIPYRQDPLRDFGVLALAGVAPQTLVTAFRKEVQALDEEIPVSGIMTLERWYSDRRWDYAVFGTLFVVFALIALLLASVGIYAVMAYSVSQRTQEIGVRLALGASGPNVIALVMKRGLIQLAIGLTIGLGGAFALTRVMQQLLISVQPRDPVTFVTITAVLLGSGLAACLIPARRATRIDPVIALRYE